MFELSPSGNGYAETVLHSLNTPTVPAQHSASEELRGQSGSDCRSKGLGTVHLFLVVLVSSSVAGRHECSPSIRPRDVTSPRT